MQIAFRSLTGHPFIGRPLLGISAAAIAVGFVLVAGLTAPAKESTLHASAKCPGGADKSPLESVASGAESPA